MNPLQRKEQANTAWDQPIRVVFRDGMFHIEDEAPAGIDHVKVKETLRTQLDKLPPLTKHPKQVEHELRAQRLRLNKEADKKMAQRLTTELKLRYVHVRQTVYTKQGDFVAAPKGGCTVAYRLPTRKGGRVIRVSVALVHEQDSYVKYLGRCGAACSFQCGNHIQLCVPKNLPTSEFLKRTFGQML